MKAGVLTHDAKLAEYVRKLSGSMEEWSFYEEIAEAGKALEEKNFDVFVLSDRYFDCNRLTDWIEEWLERKLRTKFIVLLTNHHDARVNEQYLKLCLTYGLQYVPPGRTRSGVAETLRELICGKHSSRLANTSNRLIAFIGSTPNIGTTVVAFGTAVKLALETAHQVCFLCLNLKSSKLHRYLGIEESPQTTLDALRADLRAQSLTAEQFAQCCKPVRDIPRLRVLFGNQIREQAEYFSPEEIEHLLSVARATFDICLVEVNAYWDNAATVCTLLKADRRIVVTTDEISHFQEDLERWLKTLAPMYGIPLPSFDLVVTQREKKSLARTVRTKDIRKETQLQVIGEVQRYADVNEFLNEGRLLELVSGSHPLNSDLAGINNTLIALCGYSRNVMEKRGGRNLRWRPGFLKM